MLSGKKASQNRAIHFSNGKPYTNKQRHAQRRAKRLILIIRFFLFFVLLLASIALLLLGLMVALKLPGGA